MPDRFVCLHNEDWKGRQFYTVRDLVRDCTVFTTRSRERALAFAQSMNEDARREESKP